MAMILAGTSISVVYFSKHNGECYVESKMLSVSVNAKSVVYELMSNRFRYQGLSVPLTTLRVSLDFSPVAHTVTLSVMLN